MTKNSLTLEQWDRSVGHHLHLIEAGAEMTARHARQLLARPDWETLAQDEMQKTEKVLEGALGVVRAALADYGSKPLVN